MWDDPVATAEALARAALTERLRAEELARVALRVTQHTSPSGEPTLCVGLARVEAADDPTAWQWWWFLLRTTPTLELFVWAVEQATGAVLYRLGLR
jgi:hypothetical protein